MAVHDQQPQLHHPLKSKEEKEEDQQEKEENNEDERDCFFESFDRVPSGISFEPEFPSSTSSSDEEDDCRISFASAIGGPFNLHEEQDLSSNDEDEEDNNFDYNVWMEEPMSVEERRRKLLKGMGFNSGRRPHPAHLECVISQRIVSSGPPSTRATVSKPKPLPSSPHPPIITRSRSQIHSVAKPSVSTESGPSLSRAYSAPPSLLDRCGTLPVAPSNKEREGCNCEVDGDDSGLTLCRIKNLDTGKEFVVSEFANDGTWSRLNDIQTGLQLTLDEFDKCLGYSPIVKQLMRRTNGGNTRKSFDIKSSKFNGRKKGVGGGLLKNIKFVANSFSGLILEKDILGPTKSLASMRRLTSGSSSTKDSGAGPGSNERLKVHQYGKSYKELTGLYMCQELKGAHQGSIWCMKFCNDGQYLATAGEDQVVHVWAISISEGDTILRPGGSFAKPELSGKKTKKGKKGVADHIVFPETVFSLSEKPICTFQGHLEDVLDLSWSKSSQYILSSSMDKTVRLWDVESKTCVKMFAHNDYVTCVQFNPIDENYFISGSLDAKVRIWSILDRHVVDWVDLHEMVTAASYTPHADAALVGSHKGSCRFFTVSDGKLNQEAQVEVKSNKRKSNAKKITGFQFAPGNPSEMLVTSADSQIRVFDGVNMVHKFQGFKNTNSQISASYTGDGRYVVCASEDSHVYIWKCQPPPLTSTTKTGGKPKRWASTRSHEHFYSKDVSVAIPWPGPTPPLPPSSFNRSDGSPSNLSDESFPSSRSQLPPLPPKPKKSPLDSETAQLNVTCSPSSNESEPFRSTSSSSGLFSPLMELGGSVRRYTTNKVGPANPDDAKGGAWGLVVVTASMTGDIRVYQNFGLPVRLRGY
ncbi:hypothetical protein LUZ60_015573 [Juncus effusus]|nr:hypothetical protein LUZ60_015573 [Juncus effusus]